MLRGLASLLTNTPSDPFTPEIVAVPTAGIERFITQGLGTILGTSGDGKDGVSEGRRSEIARVAALTRDSCMLDRSAPALHDEPQVVTRAPSAI